MTTEEFYGSNFAIKKVFNPFSPSRLLRERRFLSLITHNIPTPSSVLDISCGRATFLNKLALLIKNCNLYGTEFNDKLVDKNSLSFPNIRFLKWDLESSNIPKFKMLFDVVICQEVIEHLTHEAQFRLVQNINMLLKPSGYLVISTPYKDTLLTLKKARINYSEFAKKFESQPIANHLLMSDLSGIMTSNGFNLIGHQSVAPFLINRFISNILSVFLLLLPKKVESYLIYTKILRVPRFQIILAKKI